MQQATTADRDAARFRRAFRQAHAGHPACLRDEWLMQPCTDARGRPLPRPLAWSRRNGPWHRHPVIFVGAAPGNAGGKGTGRLGAHGTRIPFGGDVAGANLDVLLGSVGLDRNHTFLTAALNQLPAAGGGEPAAAEILAPVGAFPTSLHLLRATVLACGPGLVVALGNVGLRALAAALLLPGHVPPPALPSLERLLRAGIVRNLATPWPAALPLPPAFHRSWLTAWHQPPRLHVLLITHPSAQNMSPFARPDTLFHTRMLTARDALRAALRSVLHRQFPEHRPPPPSDGIYALPEWRELVGPRHRRLDDLWRARGV